jgi:hypothetical protein
VSVTAPRGTPEHEYLCDAVLMWGGFVLVNDGLHEIIRAEVAPEGDAFVWLLRPRRHAGRA